MITIQVNGDKKEVPEGLTLKGLLEWMKLPGDRVAVERNLEIVPRQSWGATPIEGGDRLEVVQFVGGGTGSKNAILHLNPSFEPLTGTGTRPARPSKR